MSLPGLGGDTSLRVLSLLATAGGLALITRAVTRLAGPATGVLAGLVLAASPLVLEQSVEARSYGLAVLATGAAALGLVRWLQEPPRGSAPVRPRRRRDGPGPLVRGHRAGRLRRRRARAARPPGAARAALRCRRGAARGPAGRAEPAERHRRPQRRAPAGHRRPAGRPRRRGLGRRPDPAAVPDRRAGGAGRGPGARHPGGRGRRGWSCRSCCSWSPSCVRPVFLPRYLLAGLLGLGVLAAAGALAAPRLARGPVAALLLACALLASAPLAERGPRERADDVVRTLAEVHRAGEPIVAADQRSATGLDHYVRLLAPELRRRRRPAAGRRPGRRRPRVAGPPAVRRGARAHRRRRDPAPPPVSG